MSTTKFLTFLLFGLLILGRQLSKADEDAATDAPDETAETESGETGEDDPVVEEEDDVIVLTEENFDFVVMDKKIILVEFYAPWCGHCKRLEPEYKKAAKTLKGNDPPVPLAKLDATAHKDPASRYDVSGYPTLKIFRNGKAYDYKGPREEAGIVSHMQEQADPSWTPPPEAVITLTDDNFDEMVNKEELILVEFYAPWCGHCKKLAPEYEDAAQQLKEMDPPIPLAKVDATVATEVAGRFGVTGYPTLKLFRNGKDYEYNGPREALGIIEYMQKQSGDSSKNKETLKNMKKYLEKQDDISIVGFFGSAEDNLYKMYLDLGNSLRDDYRFAHTFDAATTSHYKAEAGSIVIFVPERFQSKYEAKRYVFKASDGDSDDLEDFYNSHKVPLVGQMTKDNAEKRYADRPLVVAYYPVDWSFEYRVATEIWRKKILEVAKDYKDLTFAIADEEEFKDQLKELELDDSGEEISIGIWGDNKKKYRMDPEEDFDEEELKEFIDAWKKGKVDPVIKSQPVPKKNNGPVKIVTGKTFEKIVLDKSKDVLLELYAPWCGHCKKLEPIYKQLGKKYKDNKNLVIAKMDATANDVPSLSYSHMGFPTIYFSKANDKNNPVKYEVGDRTLEKLVEFIEYHATVDVKTKVKTEL
ncbi:protein disulfide-isomerase A4-like [Anneissia japonica]|uniref:protein disulfide-isomerase A4-like n=1 Tax=Anneissia japonica TaxID=1529436 RepID=UPI0014255CC7|nr:protein disulfide-isomerase A4-like [Anneissia japonica]